ncbi:MATE family efflux transporter [Saccharicrinis fermentans]|uniref:DNA-damage-inducible SOS response protein n=1 Tax=Saccharicrinis fermentans DSM 9555 = JCM 21142 TaxID=869213 RepID=W7Y3V7_9BACT|nr:MATE family efflux transporter [Saccharicrinis fermentans]GAF05550.1 DNA-damage-inducible SOS response protein [Saccharicrinis fermentans DSM 9555 = JCM 21142]
MHKDILKLSVPNILSNLTVPLLSMVDLHLMGYLDSEIFMGAVALGGVIFNFVYWGFAFLRMSISGIAAQAYGKKNHQEMAMVLFRGMLIALTGSLILLLFQSSLERLSFWLLEGSADVKELARNYYYVRIWAAPAAISLMVINGWFLGMQNALYPMLISVLINIINIGCSFLLVREFGMEERGVAMGSVIAQYFGLVLALILFLKKYKNTLHYLNIKAILVTKHLKDFLHVSSDIFIRTWCVISVFTFFTSKSAGFGDIALAANSALLQFLFLFSYFLDGFAYAAEAIVGKYFGAHNKKKLKEASRKLFYWGTFFGLSFTLVYLFAGKQMLHFFTDKEMVINEASQYLIWLIFIPIASFASYIWDGIYIGATASKAMRNTMLISSILFFFVPYYLLVGTIGLHALWLSMLLFMLSRSVSQSIWLNEPFFLY